MAIVFLAIFQLSFVRNDVQEVYEAVDEYKNVVFVLTLNPDKTYTFQENFFDGSVWKDAGSWSQQANKLQMKSTAKSRREHTYLKFEKAYKFSGDEFKMAGDTLFYEGKGNQKLNGHYRSLLILKRKQTKAALRIEHQ
ncbi:MAG: hypothetical protein Q8J69_06155 [Sphingobacteriaceae bacterium]|nr:hypothetical protein [Sphingobacteriaceae bacterium]